MSNGSDPIRFEEESSGGVASFTPPITPPVTGSPGPNKTLQTDGCGVVGWYPTVAASTVLVFKPGGVAAPGVYTTWATLYAAFTATVGLVTIVFDNTSGALVIPSGGPYDFAYRADWVGLNVSIITIQNTTGAATIKNVRRIVGPLFVDTDSTTFPPMAWDRIGGISEPRVWISQDVTLQATLGTVSLIQVPTSLSLTIYADWVSTIGPAGGGTNSVVKLSAAPCTLIVDLRGGSSFNKNAVNAPASTTVQVNWGATETFDTTQANALGTVNYQESSEKLFKADEEFIGNIPGAFSWTTTPASGAGAATATAPASSDATTPGVWSSSTGTTAGGRSFSFLGANGNLGDIVFASGAGPQFVEWIVRIPAITQVGETFFAVFGWGDNPTSGTTGEYNVCFRIETTNLLSCVVRTAGADTALTLATAIAFPENVWRRLRISHDGTTCKFEWGLGRTGQLTTLHTFAMSSALLTPFLTNRMGLLAKIQKATGINPCTIEYDRARYR